MKHQPAARGGGVDHLVQGPKSNVALAKSPDTIEIRSCTERPSRSRDGMTRVSPGAHVVQAVSEFFASGVLAGLLIRVGLLASGGGEGVQLAVQQLAGGRDPRVPDECAPAADRIERIPFQDKRFGDISPRPRKQTAVELGIHPVTPSKWLRQDDIDHGLRPGKSSAESAELRAARRRIRELEGELAIVRQAAKFLGEDKPLPKGSTR